MILMRLIQGECRIAVVGNEVLQEIVEHRGGDRVDVQALLKGECCHNYSPSTQAELDGVYSGVAYPPGYHARQEITLYSFVLDREAEDSERRHDMHERQAEGV